MTATLRWNRLIIEAENDKEFRSEIQDHFGNLLKLPHRHVEVDLGRCRNLGEDSFKLIGARVAEAAKDKELTLRVGLEWKKYVLGTGLANLVRVSVVDHMGDSSRPTALLAEDKDATALKPEEDEEPEDASQTRIQTRSSTGALVDAEDGGRFEVGDELVIGREPPSTPVFSIPTISKRHFRVYLQGAGYFIEDLRSTNGTYLNGNPLTQPQPLAEGDEVVVAITLKHPDGAKRFKFTMKS